MVPKTTAEKQAATALNYLLYTKQIKPGRMLQKATLATQQACSLGLAERVPLELATGSRSATMERSPEKGNTPL